MERLDVTFDLPSLEELPWHLNEEALRAFFAHYLPFPF
jgi:hypothetical protein